jgi:predicted MFS family arabinose efflux permease
MSRAAQRDQALLFASRSVRLFAFGFLSVVLVLYLVELGYPPPQVGLLLTLTLLGDTLLSLWITTRADRLGRRRMLLLGAGLMLAAGGLFLVTRNFLVLALAATLGVISPSGNEVGPFLAVEQAALAQLVPAPRRTHVYAWYNLAGSLATALGALCGGGLSQLLQQQGLAPLASYRAVLAGYALLGALLALLSRGLSAGVEAPSRVGGTPGLFTHLESRRGVLRLAALFSLDAFAGGFVVQSFMAWWFHTRFGVSPGALGAIFFGANLLAGCSALAAARIAARIGLIRTMVFTHLPSNLLLMAVPLMPDLPSAVAVLLLRFSISQMDVPTRQAFTMAVARPGERAAAAGVTGTARTLGAALSPALAGPMMASPALLALPFFLAGGLKVLYDLLLFRSFRGWRVEGGQQEPAMMPGVAGEESTTSMNHDSEEDAR